MWKSAVIGALAAIAASFISGCSKDDPIVAVETKPVVPAKVERTLKIKSVEAYEKATALLLANLQCALVARYIPGNFEVPFEQPHWNNADILQPEMIRVLDKVIEKEPDAKKAAYREKIVNLRRNAAKAFNDDLDANLKAGYDPKKFLVKDIKKSLQEAGFTDCYRVQGSTTAFIDLNSE